MMTARLAALVAVIAVVAACGSPAGASPSPAATPPRSAPIASPSPSAPVASPTRPAVDRLVLLAHDSFLVSDGIIEAFEAAHGIDVQVVTGGDAGETVNRAILTRDAPLADVLYGVDNTLLGRAVNAGIFDPYESTELAAVDVAMRDALSGQVTPIDYGDVCLNYDRRAFADDGPAVPMRLEDLTTAAYRGMLVVENPATSSPGLAFMLATHSRFGSGWLDYWADLVANDVLVVNDWETAYYTSFSGGAAGAGDRPIVVSYATSPAAEVVFSETPITEAPTGVITDGCFRQVEYAGVLRGTRAPELARRFIDFMLSPEFQRDIPLNMFVFPARTGLELPAEFVDNAAVVESPTEMDAGLDSEAVQALIEEWTDVVLR
jgi:thiamine transport system substrate-binding protein